MRIRRIDAGERAALSLPLQRYAFQPSPVTERDGDPLLGLQPYLADNVTLVVEDEGAIVAEVSAIPMRQNVRGPVYPMAGVAGAASDPLARRRGHVRTLMTEILGQMRDSGHAVSALHPFRPSFYQKFGYIGLPKPRTTTFSPTALAPLLSAEIPGEVSVERISEGYATYRDFTIRTLEWRHGFAVYPDYRAVQLRDADQRWLVTARTGTEVVGVLTYRITGFGGELVADELLTSSAAGRELLLQFFARHIDQVSTVALPVAADETPEVWAPDLEAETRARVSLPRSPAPMARVLSVDALAGMQVGSGQVAIHLVDDPLVAGDYVLDGTNGALAVTRGETTSPAAATLTVAGLSGLVYGVLDPDDVVLRGLGTLPDGAATQLRRLFPRRVPHLSVHF